MADRFLSHISLLYKIITTYIAWNYSDVHIMYVVSTCTLHLYTFIPHPSIFNLSPSTSFEHFGLHGQRLANLHCVIRPVRLSRPKGRFPRVWDWHSNKDTNADIEASGFHRRLKRNNPDRCGAWNTWLNSRSFYGEIFLGLYIYIFIYFTLVISESKKSHLSNDNNTWMSREVRING